MKLETREAYCVRMVRAGTRSVIDIGCGTGSVLNSLPGVDRRVGVDTDGELIAIARAAVPAAQFEVIDGGRLPFEDSSFEVAVLSEVLEHVGNANKVGVVNEALRVLAPGGRLIVTCPHRGPFSRLDPLDFKRSMPRLYAAYRSRRGGSPKTAADIGHVPLTRSEVDALLQGRTTTVDLRLGGPVSPLLANVMLVLMLTRRPDSWRYALAQVSDREQSLPSPPWFAHALRMTVELDA
ncbi:class I SAM-dependent methyltransferase [Paraconexibacter sp.]|uniref:class I SAM-dependent methyltransferase n=1 Tax=Paraconexibacter sp. TaxID=2949640 RepID=UPI0035644BA8